MVYQGLVIFQTVIVIACIVFIRIASTERRSSTSKLMLVIAFLCLIMNAAYLIEMQATTVEGVMIATKIKFFGGSFLGTFFLLYCANYCERPVPQVLLFLLFSWDLFVTWCAWTCDKHTLFFQSVKLVNDGVMPHVEKTFGWVYIVNVVIILAQLVSLCVLSQMGWKNGRNQKYKKGCAIMFFCAFVPIFTMIAQSMKLIHGFEPMPSLTAASIMVFFAAILIQKIFDISDVAHENIFLNMKEPVIILDENYGFIEANAKATEMYPSLKNCEMGELLPEQTLLAYVRTGVLDKLYHKNRVYDVHVDRIYEDELPIGFSILLTDLTEEFNQMKKIQSLMDETKKADQAKTDFWASTSHEIRTLINSIIGMNEMIIREEKNDDIKKYAYDVKNAETMLLSLINDILDTSKISSGKLTITPVQYSMSKLITELFGMMKIRANQKELQLIFDIDPRLPVSYIGDDIRIRQVLINLITNGIKYTDEGSVTLKITGEVEGNTAFLHFSIKDTGFGIPEESIEQIFSRFDRGHNDRNHYIEGTGLGLNVSASLLELMDSRIQITSEVGVGSEFSFDLKQSIVDDTPIGMFDENMVSIRDEKQYEASFVAPNAHLLVVDDNEMNLRVFSSLLKSTQVQITKAASGRECLEYVRKQHFDMIFLDHMMPEMDGIETLERMKQMPDNQSQDTPVIMLTANAVHGAREQYISEGFADFLSKPIFSDQLETMIRRHLPEELLTINDKKIDGAADEAPRELTEPEEFDFSYAMRTYKEEKELELALQDFSVSLPKEKKRLEMLYEGISQEETQREYQMYIHTLKGTSAMVGALLLSKLCLLLETACMQKDEKRMDMLHAMLMEEMDKHEKRLEAFAPKTQTEHYTKNEEREMFSMLRMALKQEDYTTADFMVKQLQMLELPEDMRTKTEQLFESVFRLESEKAVAQIDEIFKDLV